MGNGDAVVFGRLPGSGTGCLLPPLLLGRLHEKDRILLRGIEGSEIPSAEDVSGVVRELTRNTCSDRSPPSLLPCCINTLSSWKMDRLGTMSRAKSRVPNVPSTIGAANGAHNLWHT